MSIHFGDKNVKEIRYGQKKVKEVWYGDKKVWPSAPSINLDLNNGQPIGRMDDGELWFRVNVKNPNEPFKIAVNGYGSASYDWDISIDGADPVRKTGSKSTTPISLPMSVGKHYVKITPHNGVAAGWARCMGNGNQSCFWNNNKFKLEFSLEWLPGYAFMESETSVGDHFLREAWTQCHLLISMPNGFNLPQGITNVGDYFLASTWWACQGLTTVPSGFNIPQNITSVGDHFLSSTWLNCKYITSFPNGFNIPQGITNIGKNFVNNTWSSCTSLTSMPNGFNIPQGITNAKYGFINSTWRYCTSLISMPSGFNIPQGITNIESYFLSRTRENCTSLTSDPSAEPINFPNIRASWFAAYCFGGTCPITPYSPTPGSSVMIRRNS